MAGSPDTDKREGFLSIITDGGTWKSAAKELGVSTATIAGWLRDDEELQKRYARACDVRAQAIFEGMLEIADDGSNDWMLRNFGDDARWVENGEAIRRSALRIDTRKWLLGKMKPKVYGDKLELSGDPDAPLAPPQSSPLDLARAMLAIVAKAEQGE
jgi:hypothetical protein